MDLCEILEKLKTDESSWLVYEDNTFRILGFEPKDHPRNRETIAKLYVEWVSLVENQGLTTLDANRFVRMMWTEVAPFSGSFSLPGIFLDDGFLRMYALGKAVSLDLMGKMLRKLQGSVDLKSFSLNPIHIEWNKWAEHFHDIDASPPGFLPKIFPAARVKKDEELIKKIHSDLQLIAQVEDSARRTWLTLAVLSHGAAYRELEGRTLKIPCFKEKGEFVAYGCFQHLIAEGVKTVSMIPYASNCPAIYLCQGTELWPSQPSMLGSVLANFAAHGSATEAYAHSWRRIHKHLRDLSQVGGALPLVCGHSMGGAMAIQIGLYSHDLVDKIYAFNPPMPHERDYHFYNQMAKEKQDKVLIVTNLDDFAFWRMGAKIIGNVLVFLGKTRWRYYPVSFLDCLLLFPAFVKFFLNVQHAFPAHQKVTALDKNFIWFRLSHEEIEKENKERTLRFDYLAFFPKLYDPLRVLLRFVRSIFGWHLKPKYLQAEIEILSLHEKDLLDTMTDENKEEIERELKELRRQKEKLLKQLRA